MTKIAKLVSSVFSTPPFRLPIIIFLAGFICLVLPSPDAHPAQVTLAWDVSTNSNIAGYKVHYGNSSGSYQAVIDVGNTTTCTIPALLDGTTYYFAASDYTTSGIESGYSNQVSYTTPAGCTYTISPASQAAGSSSVSGTVNVTASSGCTWTAVSNVSWIIITSNSSVVGNGTASYSVSANSGTTSRTGTMAIAGKTFTVTQSGSSQSSGSWTFCANEGQQCSFTGTQNVRFGANGTYVFKSLTNGTMCSNSVFGDPLYGVAKQCYIGGSGTSSTFTITASAGSGGTISPSGSAQVASGGSQTFTVTPSNGYQVGSLLVDGTNMGALTTYTFSNVTANHTISASFASSSASWTFCANENEQCSFTGTKNVRYGANGTYVFKSLTNGTMCSNSVFGDPLYGVANQCYIQQ